MPVVFLRKSEISSNKPPKEDWDRISYSYEREGEKVKVLVPKIDKIALTSLSLKNSVCKDFNELIPNLVAGHQQQGWFTPISVQEAVKLGIRGYKYCYWISVPGTTERILLQARPTGQTKTRYFRYEFNPARLGLDGLKGFKKRISIFGPEGDYSHLLKQAVITRIDVAIDFINAPIDGLIVTSAGGGKRHAYFAGHGSVQTMYLGIKKGDKSSNHYAYNRKQKEIEDNNDSAAKWPPTTRLEFRVNPKKLPFGSLPMIANPLERMHVMDPGAVQHGLDPTMWRLFIDSCVLRGPENALALLPGEIRPPYEAALKEAAAIWKPAKLWSHWGMELDEARLLTAQARPSAKKKLYQSKVKSAAV